MNHNDEILLSLGIDQSRFAVLMSISQYILAYKENESARSYIGRIEELSPGTVSYVFGSLEAAELVLRDQIMEMNEAIRRIRVLKGKLRSNYRATPHFVVMIARATGVLIYRDEDPEDWARRVEDLRPGITTFIAGSDDERRDFVRESVSMFWARSDKSKSYLIETMLNGVVALMIIHLLKMLVTDERAWSLCVLVGSVYFIMLSVDAFFAYRSRRMFFKAERGGSLI